MSPTVLLAIAALLFVAPATYVLTVSFMSQHGSLGTAALPDSAETALWAAGGAMLFVPFAIRRFLRSADRGTQLLLVLVVTVAASVFGLVLSFTTGKIAPVWVLSAASMLGILCWSYVYRKCFEAQPIGHIAPRYTTVLVVLGSVSLAFVVFRVSLWGHLTTSSGEPASTRFMIFIDTLVGAAALSTARLRKLGSTYAASATRALSWALLPIPVLGTLTSLYWILSVRKQEQQTSSVHAV